VREVKFQSMAAPETMEIPTDWTTGQTSRQSNSVPDHGVAAFRCLMWRRSNTAWRFGDDRG
jgi:hypothetical protein